MPLYDKDPLTAMEAVTAAQWLAFAPLAFQATAAMRDRGVLAALDGAGPEGCTLEEVVQATGLSGYATRVLLEAGLGLQILWRKEGRFRLGKLGRFLLDDEMTRVNFDFTRDVCYQAAAHLDTSLREGRPAGLQALGPWATLYEGLSVMPEPARASWHAFDHFYSDRAFPAACERLAAGAPARLLDVGCNTGRWAQYCLERLPDLQIGLVDLQPQLVRAQARLEEAGLAGRVRTHAVNLLEPGAALPSGYDLIWMSQFLDCFSEEQVVAILRKARAALPAHGRVWIMELFWDRQRFEAAAFSLQQTSLYFSCVANGNSQMYDSAVFLRLVEEAGLTVSRLTDGVGGYHTLLECRPAS
ncbi:MAG TPA: class I SAM-dependent methyltransferase [Ramlibacter sp.]|nr:class I SAM-dependent methyltransferase [Ramlibacter sp.]